MRSARDLIWDTADKIMKSRPLNVSVLERYVLLISDIPGLAVRTVIKPSENTPGAVTLVFIIDRNAVSGQTQIDNRGSRAIGPEEGQVTINFNSILGLDEQTSLLLATTAQPKQLQYGQLTSTWILNTEGLRFSTSGSYSDFKAEWLHRSPRCDRPHTRRPQPSRLPAHPFTVENLHLAAEFTYLNSTTDLLGTKFSDDRLRYFSASATYDIADTLLGDAYPASTIIDAELSSRVFILSTRAGPDH